MPTIPVFLNKQQSEQFKKLCEKKKLNPYRLAKIALEEYLERNIN